MRISIIVPTLNAAPFLYLLVESLRNQILSPDEIVIIDSDSTDGTVELAYGLGCKVLSTARSAFNHGGTRNLASIYAQGDILVFMTQDALPVDSFFLQHLIGPIISGKAIASYARQVAYSGASVTEKFARDFNYPPVSQLRTYASIDSMGVEAYLFSNVSSAIRKDKFMDVGMFEDNVIMNEDMLICANLLSKGHTVAYVADAKVYHSHDYSLGQTFRRYFDIGVFFARHFNRPNLSANGRGVDYSRKLIVALVRKGDVLALFRAVFEIGAKYAGFKLGKIERFIPLELKKHLSMHTGFWSSASPNKAAF